MARIQIIAVKMHASCEVVPVMRDTSDRLMLPETGADPTIAATPQETPWATSSRGALHGMPLSASNQDAMPMMDKKLTPANKRDVITNAGHPPMRSATGASKTFW